ncbi:hypothetical protein [uncultured Paludibaculum sp.]|uniref:hypothetical protein n=1 Tax=uncultured Paludibaculum sp. TaxID=1765020 RepID=UPI002AAC1D14|nr:hypothetical protein [uncultured Paludibaculum sp.]
MKLAAVVFFLASGCVCAQPPEAKPKPSPRPELTVERTDVAIWPGELKALRPQAAIRWEYAMMIAEAGKPTQIFPPRAVEPITGGLLVEELNLAGSSGWEVVGTTSVKPGQLTVLLKRTLLYAPQP